MDEEVTNETKYHFLEGELLATPEGDNIIFCVGSYQLSQSINMFESVQCNFPTRPKTGKIEMDAVNRNDDGRSEFVRASKAIFDHCFFFVARYSTSIRQWWTETTKIEFCREMFVDDKENCRCLCLTIFAEVSDIFRLSDMKRSQTHAQCTHSIAGTARARSFPNTLKKLKRVPRQQQQHQQPKLSIFEQQR